MITEKRLSNLAAKILKLLDERNATLDIFLLPHAEIKALKARFIKKQTEPNVIAFPEPKSFPHPEYVAAQKNRRAKRSHSVKNKTHYLGEVYLNKNILAKSPERAAPLLLHGILHLLGYDHKKKADIVKMESLEEKIIKKLPVGRLDG